MSRTISRAACSFTISVDLMPEQARILRFPGRLSRQTPKRDALSSAREYLLLSLEERRKVDLDDTYGDLDILLAICGGLREQCNSKPSEVLAESSRIFEWLSSQRKELGYFDERNFFLGESALLAASACRHVGDRADTELWLDRADANYRHTINPAPSLARVAYVRLSLRYDAGRYGEILELAPSIALTFANLGMNAELAKCRFLEAMTLKELGRFDEAAANFQGLLSEEAFQSERMLRGLAMMNLGNIRSMEGDQREALVAYRAAQPLLQSSENRGMLADLKGMVGETLRQMGQVGAAIDAYREAVSDYVGLGMETRAAYVRVSLSETLLGAGRPREAEWELLAALPTINEQRMVPEGFAAVALLQESVRQRKTDPKALTELRQYLGQQI